MSSVFPTAVAATRWLKTACCCSRYRSLAFFYTTAEMIKQCAHALQTPQHPLTVLNSPPPLFVVPGVTVAQRVQGDQDGESSVVGGVLQMHLTAVLACLFHRCRSITVSVPYSWHPAPVLVSYRNAPYRQRSVMLASRPVGLPCSLTSGAVSVSCCYRPLPSISFPAQLPWRTTCVSYRQCPIMLAYRTVMPFCAVGFVYHQHPVQLASYSVSVRYH